MWYLFVMHADSEEGKQTSSQSSGSSDSSNIVQKLHA